MKPCKKCKLYIKEMDLERYAVHLIETHGFFKSDVIEKLPVNIEIFDKLWLIKLSPQIILK
jgi:hypothetical protein